MKLFLKTAAQGILSLLAPCRLQALFYLRSRRF
jgi:hypothetical protein